MFRAHTLSVYVRESSALCSCMTGAKSEWVVLSTKPTHTVGAGEGCRPRKKTYQQHWSSSVWAAMQWMAEVIVWQWERGVGGCAHHAVFRFFL